MSTDPFELLLQTNALVETIRVLTALLGLGVLLAALVRLLQHQHVAASLGYLSLGLLTSLQEVEALGDPFYPWRLPLFILTNLAAAWVLYLDRPERPAAP